MAIHNSVNRFTMQDKFSLNLDDMKASQIYNLILFILVNISITIAQNPVQQAINQFVKDPVNIITPESVSD